MTKQLIILIFLAFSILVGYFSLSTYKRHLSERKVLSESSEGEKSENLPTATPTLTPSPSPTLSPTPKPTRTPTPTTVPQPKVSQPEIHALMERFAGQYSVDVNILRHIAVCESGFNPSAINGRYAGLFQFDDRTWTKSRISIGEDTNPNLRFNAEESIQTAAYLISQGKRSLWPNCYP